MVGLLPVMVNEKLLLHPLHPLLSWPIFHGFLKLLRLLLHQNLPDVKLMVTMMPILIT